MSQQPTSNPQQLTKPLIIFLWIGIGLWLATACSDVFASITKQSIITDIITPFVSLLSIPIGILQIKPQILSWVKQTIRTGLLGLGIVALAILLLLNIRQLQSPSNSSKAVVAPSANTSSPTDSVNCPQSVVSPHEDPRKISIPVIPPGCAAVLESYSGFIADLQPTWGTSDGNSGGFIAISAGHYSGWFSDGTLYFYPADEAYASYCQLLHDASIAKAVYHKYRPLEGWKPCN